MFRARRLKTITSIAAATLTLSVPASATGGTKIAAKRIEGFGATVKIWDITHIGDHRGNVVPGCCFDPTPVPGLIYGDRYYAVQPSDGLVTSYEMHLKPTSVTHARAIAMRELPSDARVVSFTVHRGSCAILIASSARLRAAVEANKAYVRSVKKVNVDFGARVSRAKLKTELGEVVIELSSGAAEATYNPRSVNDLLLSSMAVAGSTAQNC